MDISSRDLNINTTKNNNNGILIFEIFDDEFSDACEYKLMKIPLKFNLFTINILILLFSIIKCVKLIFLSSQTSPKTKLLKGRFIIFTTRMGFFS